MFAASTQCPTGGITVDSGIDENNNGVLDDDEIDTTQELCNGLNGKSFTLVSNGSEVGTVLGVFSGSYVIATEKGYTITISRDNGFISYNHQPLFETFDCSGNYYAYAPSPGTILSGLVPNGNGTKALFYIDKYEIPTARAFNSQYVQTGSGPDIFECQIIPAVPSQSVKILPFDEVITGFSPLLLNADFNFDMPLTIEATQ